ncbi:uncharacterized protein PFL1_01424 [Pseudozyma flocculosa PF-1]|uniref:uncharacterized protein n=1 Tax=Pseudozyma flocculosa PF-1 TaxID=1277687 RepID=UPI000456024B|nr:uncharacterized protein PFL1_01424 [Pseudozyma flocculosa PF-1]EPQ31239.1 hypothetical protein PFL1_01424 [Pseudozyma flocculosa PF-1]
MSWRSNAQRTGMNAQPLGNARRWGGGGGAASPSQEPAAAAGGGYGMSPPRPNPMGMGGPNMGMGGPNMGMGGPNMGMGPPGMGGPGPGAPGRDPREAAAAAAAAVAASIGIKRDRDDNGAAASPVGADGAPRKRRSRWGDAADQVNIPTAIGANVSQQELDRYAIQVRLDEISRKLRSGDYVPPDRERSPSPPPTYDNQGRRTNTREVRYRKRLEDERMALVERQMQLDPNFRPPAEYHAAKRNTRPTEKVFLPLKEFPEINFFGLLVGPRGNTLKKMERESGAKISIRGKGSVKEGKGRAGADEDEEDMHCVVQADDEAAVKKCIRLINQVIETAASTPEGENDHKRNQLRELAALNGTLRDDENQICKNCGNKGHRAFECPEQRNWTAHIICHRCGGQGHLARDCTQGRGGAFGPGGVGGARQFDSEYASLMAELGEGGGAAAGPAGAAGPVVGAPGFRGGYGGGGGRGGYPNQGYGGPQQGPPGAGYYGQQPGYGSPVAPAATGANSVPPGGAAAGGQAGAQPDYSAEWAAYYAQQAAAGNGAAAAAAPAGAEGQGQAAAGQDYTKEWEEYYRQQAAAAAAGGQAGAAGAGQGQY